MSDGFVSVARLLRESVNTLFNLINTRSVEIFFQMSPGRPSGDTRGVDTLEYNVFDSRGNQLQGPLQTGPDGRIQMLIRGGEGRLQVLFNGNPVCTYTVRIRDTAIEAVNTRVGIQRRLRLLGYHVGDGGAQNNGVTSNANPMNTETDRSILEYQTDQGQDFTGLETNANLQNALTNANTGVGG
jgi:hypothetical protein